MVICEMLAGGGGKVADSVKGNTCYFVGFFVGKWAVKLCGKTSTAQEKAQRENSRKHLLYQIISNTSADPLSLGLKKGNSPSISPTRMPSKKDGTSKKRHERDLSRTHVNENVTKK
jgi:hypothetical protein